MPRGSVFSASLCILKNFEVSEELFIVRALTEPEVLEGVEQN